MATVRGDDKYLGMKGEQIIHQLSVRRKNEKITTHSIPMNNKGPLAKS